MVVDGQGFFWIANGWLAAALGCLVLGLVLWCHGWIATDRPWWPARRLATMWPRLLARSTARERGRKQVALLSRRRPRVWARHRGWSFS